MRLLVAALEFRDAETTFKVTASFGVAAVAAGEPTNADEIMKTADERLYAAKSNGRNRVES